MFSRQEYFAPFSQSCRLPINFVGKIENLAEDWKNLLESQSCITAKIPYNNSLGQHPTDEKERKARVVLFFSFFSDIFGSLLWLNNIQ